MDAMKAALLLIERGVIEVRPDGTIWKLRNENRIPFSGPRRLETTTKRGYLAIRFYVDGKPYMLAAHRLVWTVLRGPIPEGMDLNHIDGNKINNDPTNIEPVTRGANHEHAYRTGLRKVTDVPAAIADKAKVLRAQGISYSKIGEALGVSQTTAFRATRVK